MEQQSQSFQARGLWLHPNPEALPVGSFWMCENASIDREGVVSKRRGFSRYGTALSNCASGLFEFDDTLIVLDGTTLQYDSDGAGTWAAWTGTFSPPDSATFMTSLESNLNFYFTTSLGVYVNDETTGTPRRSGTPEGLDLQLSFTGTGRGFFTNDTMVGYEVLFLIKDANENEKRGAPSFRETLTNSLHTLQAWTVIGAGQVRITQNGHGYANLDYVNVTASTDGVSLADQEYQITWVDANNYDVAGAGVGGANGTCTVGKDFDVSITFTLPEDIVAGDQYELYRTELTVAPIVAGTTDPGYRFYRVITGTVTAPDVANGYITVLDDLDEDLYLDTPLYTNDNEEGASAENSRPPFAKYMASYEGHTWYACIKQPHFLEIQLMDISGLVDDTSAITVTCGGTVETYTFSAAENLGAKKFQRYTTLSDPENVRFTAKSLCKVINRTSVVIYCFYISGPDDAPGKLLFKKRTLESTDFSLTADLATTGDNFYPEIPIAGTTLASTQDEGKNVIARSKYQQPEAVPALSTKKLGRANRAILGLASLKEALLVYKEDGIFILSGESDGNLGANFADDELDPTIRIVAPGSLCLLDNAAWVFTDQGVVISTPSSRDIASRPVEVELDRIAKFTDFNTITKAVGYESDRKYLLFLQEGSADTRAKIVWVYNTITQAWTTWRKNVSGGLVKLSDKKLYLMDNVDTYILQERKTASTNGADQQDEDESQTITATGTTTYNNATVQTITIAAWAGSNQPAEGWRVVQGALSATVRVATLVAGATWLLTLSSNAGFVNGAADFYKRIYMKIEWAPFNMGAGATLKQFCFVTVIPEIDSGTHRLGFKSDMQDDWDFTGNIFVTRTRGWGSSPWGSAWGSEPPGKITGIRSCVHRDHQWGRTLQVRYENMYAMDDVSILLLTIDYRGVSVRNERGAD